MTDQGILRGIINVAIKEKGTQTVLADEVGCDGAALSRFISGEGPLKLEQIERIMRISGVRIITEKHYSDLHTALEVMSRLWMEDRSQQK
jgi:hypothetical protein